MLIFFVVLFGSLYLAFHFQGPVMQRFGWQDENIGTQPPWYFITRDFAEGICSAGAFLLCLGVAVVIWRWWPSYASMMVWMPLIFHGGHIAKGWIIYQSCPGLLDGQRITSRWPTFNSYLGDAGIKNAESLVLFSGVLLAAVLPWADLWVRRRLSRKAA